MHHEQYVLEYFLMGPTYFYAPAFSRNIYLGVIQQLSGQNFAIFWPLPPN